MGDEIELSDEDLKAIEKAIGEPFMEDFSENTLRIRRNLLAISSIALFYKLGGLQINGDSSFLGVKLDGLTPDKVDWAFFLILVYLGVHFLWNSLSHFHEWRLRLTGSKAAYVTGSFWGGEHEDAPPEPRQSTLYFFLLQKRHDMEEVVNALSQLRDRLRGWEPQIGNPNVTQVQPTLGEIKNNLERVLQVTSYILRIPVSLRRFEKWFWLFHWNQSARWLVLEWLFPLVLGAWAIVLVRPFWQSYCY